MTEQNRQLVERILVADQVTESDMRNLELASGVHLLTRITPIPGATGGMVIYSASEVRKLIEAGLIPQTR